MTKGPSRKGLNHPSIVFTYFLQATGISVCYLLFSLVSVLACWFVTYTFYGVFQMEFEGEILPCPELPNCLKIKSRDGEMHESQVQPFRFENRILFFLSLLHAVLQFNPGKNGCSQHSKE